MSARDILNLLNDQSCELNEEELRRLEALCEQ
jgi:hypothetical protein